MIEYYRTELGVLYCGSALQVLKEMPANMVDCVMTSPPYWALRDYGSDAQVWDGDEDCEHEFNKYDAKLLHENRQNLDGGTLGNPEYRENLHGLGNAKAGFCSKCGAWKGELGLEPTFELYIKHLCDIFDEVKRVLKDTGMIFVNLGDTYGGSGMGTWKSNSSPTGKQVYTIPYGKNMSARLRASNYAKSLCCIPERFMIEMVSRGWILRNKIIWYKKNCMPSSAKDRFTVDWEVVLFFSKKKKYYFEQQFEKCTDEDRLSRRFLDPENIKNRKIDTVKKVSKLNPKTAEKSRQFILKHGRNKRCVWQINPRGFPEAHFAVFPEELCWTPIKAGCPKDGTAMDIFMGSGTVGLVAEKLQRKWIGIEISEKYNEIAKQRIQKEYNQIKIKF